MASSGSTTLPPSAHFLAYSHAASHSVDAAWSAAPFPYRLLDDETPSNTPNDFDRRDVKWLSSPRLSRRPFLSYVDTPYLIRTFAIPAPAAPPIPAPNAALSCQRSWLVG